MVTLPLVEATAYPLQFRLFVLAKEMFGPLATEVEATAKGDANRPKIRTEKTARKRN